MPSKALYSDSDIIKVLKKYNIFHSNKKLKKKKFKEPDGTNVWKRAQAELPLMRLQSLYLFVLQNRRQVRHTLKKYHFPKVDQDISAKASKVKSDDNQSHHSSDSECHHSLESENDNLTTNELKEDQIIVKPDEYVQLHRLKYNVLFHDIIHRISINPFCVTYWSAQQTNIFKDMLNIDGRSICVIVLKDFLPSIQLRKYTSNNNCLVSIACSILDIPTFIANLITETLDRQKVQHFIMDFFKKIPSLPSEITVVYHRSTIEEVCFALNTCSLSEHNAQCLSYFESKGKALPKVLISIDLTTLLVSASKSPHFKIKTEDIQKSLIKIIIYLKYVLNLEDFKTTVMEILFLICSPFENQDTLRTATIIDIKIDSPVISALYEDFRKFTVDNVLSNFAAISDVESDKSSCDLLKYIDDLDPKIDEKLCKKGKPNPYYCKLWYTTTLRFVLAEFPSWTCIISKSRDMNLIKNVSRNHVNFVGSNNSLKMFVFVETHILQCDEQVQRRRAFLNQKRVKKLKKETTDKAQSCTRHVLHLDYQENWGGLNACYKKKELIIESKCDETKIEYDLLVPPLEDIHKLHEISNNVSAKQSTDEKPNLMIDEVTVVDSFFTRTESDNCDSILNTKHDIEELISKKAENSVTHASMNILLSSSTFPNEEFNNSDVLAGSNFEKNTNNVSSIISQSLDCIGVPCKNSTLSSDEKNCNLSSEEVLLEHDYSTFSLLNKNIDSNNGQRMIDEKEVDFENSFAHQMSVKRPLEVDSSEVCIPVKKKRKAGADTKKKKYLTRCPDMHLRHQQAANSKSSRKDSLIRNGNVLEPRSIDLKKYSLDNTSQFDVLAEILSFGYKNCITFRNYCDNVTQSCSAPCLLSLITKFSKKSNLNSLYSDRFTLLCRYATIDETLSKISIMNNLQSFFGSIMSEHSSYNVHIFCKNCNIQTIHEYCVINLSDDCNSMTSVHELLCSYFENSIPLNNCFKCKNQGFLSSFQLNPYLAIYFKKGKLFAYIDFAETYIQFCNELKYMLIGVVTFESEDNPGYVAYCRKPSGSWEKRSGQETHILYCKYLEEANIVFLIYLKI